MTQMICHWWESGLIHQRNGLDSDLFEGKNGSIFHAMDSLTLQKTLHSM